MISPANTTFARGFTWSDLLALPPRVLLPFTVSTTLPVPVVPTRRYDPNWAMDVIV